MLFHSVTRHIKIEPKPLMWQENETRQMGHWYTNCGNKNKTQQNKTKRNYHKS